MAITAKPVAKPVNVNLELSRLSRYFYNNTVYEKGVVYVFDESSARTILRLTDPAGLPVFGLAKARTKLVQIPVEVKEVAIRPVPGQVVDSTVNPPASPIGRLDLGDDDPEIQEKLKNADAELIDTGAAVTI